MKILNDINGNINGKILIDDLGELSIIIEALDTFSKVFDGSLKSNKLQQQFEIIKNELKNTKG